jgi:4'-phosphopantetheinyl transferase
LIEVAIHAARVTDVHPMVTSDELRTLASTASIAGRSLARRVLGRALGVDPLALAFADGPHGKPALVGASLAHSVAHGGDYVIVAVARGGEVGVDVEPIVPGRRFEAIAEAALGNDALAALLAVAPAARPRLFTRWWVQLEAIAKATGRGLEVPVDRRIPDGYRVAPLPPFDGHVAAVAWSGGPARIVVSAGVS